MRNLLAIAHPPCLACHAPMWLVRVDRGEVADVQHFSCKVCGKTITRTVAVDMAKPPPAGAAETSP